jgi:hypothetical protein
MSCSSFAGTARKQRAAGDRDCHEGTDDQRISMLSASKASSGDSPLHVGVRSAQQVEAANLDRGRRQSLNLWRRPFH